jgi:hypothetical protein
MKNYKRGFAPIILLIIIAALAIGGGAVYYKSQKEKKVEVTHESGNSQKEQTNTDTKVDETITKDSVDKSKCGLLVTSVSANAKVSFPVVIKGVIDNTAASSKGCSWQMFEGQAGTAQLFYKYQSSWYSLGVSVPVKVDNWTSAKTNFTVTLNFNNDGIGLPNGTPLKVVFSEENASGMSPVDTFELPIVLASKLTQPNNQASLTLKSLTPVLGKVGTEVTITGTGFTSTDNQVFLNGDLVAQKITSPSGASLKFTITSTSTGSIGYPLLPGTYNISVKNSKGVSNTLAFTVTAPAVGPFSATHTSGSKPLTVYFSGNIGGYTGYSIGIDFGDGTELSAMGMRTDCSGSGCSRPNLSAEHTYTSAGTYTAKFVKYTGCSPSAQRAGCNGPSAQVIGTIDTVTISSL